MRRRFHLHWANCAFALSCFEQRQHLGPRKLAFHDPTSRGGPARAIDRRTEESLSSERSKRNHVRATASLKEEPMRATYWLMAAVLGLQIMGCGGTSTAPSSSLAPATVEARQALSPTGKLRVALPAIKSPKRHTGRAVGGYDGRGF